MMMKDFCLLLFWMLGVSLGYSQNSVGLLSYEQEFSSPGHNLFFSHNQANVYLTDACGQVVHEWVDEDNFRPGNAVYLLENGNLVKCKRDQFSAVNDAIWAGGGGETVEILTWDNEVVASFTLNDSLFRLHHDVAPLPNGNVLMIAWEAFSNEMAVDAGRVISSPDSSDLWALAVLEWNPFLDSIVWEWHAWDHLVQDRSPLVENFGEIAEHPERIDINYAVGFGSDWMHTNAIDYNSVLDQIVVSVPHFDELWIIDHSTSNEESASSVGGNAGKGGDLLYRWGNPVAYDQGDSTDQQLFFQHDVHWIKPDAERSDADFGKLIMFNNRLPDMTSSINILRSPIDSFSYPFDDSGLLGPLGFERTIVHPENNVLASSRSVSSAQILENGNVLGFAGLWGYGFELNENNRVVWEYRVPFKGGQAVAQGSILDITNNLTFRMHRYALDFPAFTDRDLVPLGYLENEPDTAFCNLMSSLVSPVLTGEAVDIYPNPVSDMINVRRNSDSVVDFILIDISGRRIATGTLQNSLDQIDVSAIREGIYFLQVGEGRHQKIIKI